MLIVFFLSVCLSVSLSISLYVYSVYDLYNNNNYVKMGEKRTSAVTNHITPKLESFGYIYVVDITGLALDSISYRFG